MFELLIVSAAIFFGGIFLFKFFFLLLGLILSGVGFVIKALITIILAIVFFPVTLVFTGGLLSTGLIGFILICAVFSALSSRRTQERNYY